MAKARKKRKDVLRTASGRPSRSKEAAEYAERVAFENGPQQTVLQARRNHIGAFKEPTNAEAYRAELAATVSKEQAKAAKLHNRGTVLGNLWADGKITDQMLAAGNDYAQRYAAYASLNGLPLPNPASSSYGAVRGGERPERLRAAVAARVAHKADADALYGCGHGVRDAVHKVAVLDTRAPLRLVVKGLKRLAT